MINIKVQMNHLVCFVCTLRTELLLIVLIQIPSVIYDILYSFHGLRIISIYRPIIQAMPSLITNVIFISLTELYNFSYTLNNPGKG